MRSCIGWGLKGDRQQSIDADDMLRGVLQGETLQYAPLDRSMLVYEALVSARCFW